MRLLVLALIPLAATTVAAVERPRLATPKSCGGELRPVEQDKEPMRPNKLGELPPASQFLTVYREVDGCPKPVVVRRDIGAPRR